MSSDGSTRATVTTYVPAYQKERWRANAEELDMTQSEFVRSMVQAGRKKFDLVDADTDDSRVETADSGSGNAAVEAPPDPAPDLERRVVAVLSAEGHLSWDELVGRLTTDIEDRVDRTLQQLQAENRVHYSGRHGGYALAGETDGE